ncbi:YlxR family protein [Ruminococcus sp. FC2018]|jgi:predicted RNA-binding protein YlxR (DUF448 family)|uniref:RNase P modulator RnpM n=1 Tax=Ruminococcus sp. FC2018 TaxID=1410617 RepID=UPI00048DA740|nr:YlxR family protein [Ruminococcus sp. FC2018]
MKTKKIPMRMCVGCGEMKPKKELIRIVTDSEGTVSVDPTGKKAGRGAYICKSTECLKKAGKSKKLRVTDEIIQQLEAEIENEQ